MLGLRRVAGRVKGRRPNHWRAPVHVQTVAVAIAVRITIVRVARGVHITITCVTIIRVAIIGIAAVRVAVRGVAIVCVTIRIVAIARIRVFVARVLVRFSIFVRVLIFRRRIIVGVFVADSFVLPGFRFFTRRRDGFAFFRRTADDDGDSLTCFDYFTGARRLIKNRVGFSVSAITRGAFVYVQSGAVKRILARHKVFAQHVRHFYFGAAKTKVNRAGQADDESDGDADDNADPAQDRQRTICLYHRMSQAFLRKARTRAAATSHISLGV